MVMIMAVLVVMMMIMMRILNCGGQSDEWGSLASAV